MTTQQVNIKPNGTEEVSSLLILKTIFDIQINEVLAMAKESHNEGVSMEANVGFFLHALLLDVIGLVQAAINNDFDAMRGNFTDFPGLALHLRKIDEQNGTTGCWMLSTPCAQMTQIWLSMFGKQAWR